MSDLTERKNEQLPAFMQEDSKMGTEDLGQFIIPPRIKTVQSTASSELKEQFDEGTVILVPQNVAIAPIIKNDKGRPTKNGTPFIFTPLFFWPEWVLWNPIELKGSEPAIHERTIDPKSPLCAKSRDPKLWSEEIEGKEDAEGNPLCRRYVEHLNWAVVLESGDAAGMTCVLSFARSEHRAGTNFAALIKMRKAPLFGCRFQGQVRHRSNNRGEWYGIDVTNPDDEQGFISDQSTYETFKELHTELRENAEKLMVDYEDAPTDEVSDSADSEF